MIMTIHPGDILALSLTNIEIKKKVKKVGWVDSHTQISTFSLITSFLYRSHICKNNNAGKLVLLQEQKQRRLL